MRASPILTRNLQCEATQKTQAIWNTDYGSAMDNRANTSRLITIWYVTFLRVPGRQRSFSPKKTQISISIVSNLAPQNVATASNQKGLKPYDYRAVCMNGLSENRTWMPKMQACFPFGLRFKPTKKRRPQSNVPKSMKDNRWLPKLRTLRGAFVFHSKPSSRASLI